MNFTAQEREDLLDALKRADEDLGEYLNHGDPEADYVGCEDELEHLKQSGDRWAALSQRLADEKDEALVKNGDNDYMLGRCHTVWIDVEGIEDLHVWMRATDPEGILVEIYGKDVMKPRLASCSFRYQ